MDNAIYIIGSEPFDEWRKSYETGENLVISGIVGYDDFTEFARTFDYTRFKNIRLENLSISEKSLAERHSNSFYDEIVGEIYHSDENIVYPLTKMFFNSDKGCGEFAVINGEILSLDRKTLIHTPESEELIIKEGIETISAFACCEYSLTTKVKLCEGLTEIGDYAFFHCENLEKLILPNSVVTLGEDSFYMAGLNEVKLSENLRDIPSGCFAYTCLSEVEIPASVREIGGEAFARTYIDSVIIPEGVESIEWNVFDYLSEVYLPSTLKEIASDFYYESVVDGPEEPPYVHVHPDNPIFYAKEGTLYFRSNDEWALDAAYNDKKK